MSKNQWGDMGDNLDEEMLEDGEQAEANRAVVRVGYRKLMDEIVGKDEELASIKNQIQENEGP